MQALQHQWKKYVDHKGDYDQKETLLGHISIMIIHWIFHLPSSHILSFKNILFLLVAFCFKLVRYS